MRKFLYSYNVTVLYVIRAILCSSSGGQITAYGIVTLSEWSWWPCSTQVKREFSLNLCTALPPRPLIRVTIQYAVYIQFDLLKLNIILFETCRGL